VVQLQRLDQAPVHEAGHALGAVRVVLRARPAGQARIVVDM